MQEQATLLDFDCNQPLDVANAVCPFFWSRGLVLPPIDIVD